MRVAIRSIASVVLGLLLLFPLGAIYKMASLPVYDELMFGNGSFATAIPALVAATFVLLGLIPWLGPVVDPGPRLVASLAVFPLVTVLFWVDLHTGYTNFSVWHATVYAAVFCLLSVVCLWARKPILVPLFLLIPVTDPILGLILVWFHGSPGMHLYGRELLSKVLPVLLASGAAVALANYVRAHKA